MFVGSFTPETIKPLVETYVASLPATHAHEMWRDLGIVPPSGVVEKTIEKGIAPRSEVAIVLSGPFEDDDPHRLALRTMTQVLQSRLLDAIRQELGGTYSITATPGMARFPRPHYEVRIDWTCDPARTSALVQRVFDEIAFVRDNPLSSEQVRLIREGLLREYERNSQDNGYLLGQISRRYADGDAASVAAVMKMPEQIAAVTGEALQQAALAHFDSSHYVKVTLMPQTK